MNKTALHQSSLRSDYYQYYHHHHLICLLLLFNAESKPWFWGRVKEWSIRLLVSLSSSSSFILSISFYCLTSSNKPPLPPQNKIKIKKGSEGFIETAPSGMGSVLYTKMNVFKSDLAIYQSLRPVLRDSQLLPVPETKDVFCLPYIADRDMNIFGIKAIKISGN